MAPNLLLTVVTPEAKVFEGAVFSVTLPGIEGEFGVLPQHVPLLTQLVPGEMRYVNAEGGHSFALGDGFVEVTGTEVNVLTDLAVGEKEIDEKATEEAMERATQALREKSLVGEELEATEASLARTVAMLKLKRRRR